MVMDDTYTASGVAEAVVGDDAIDTLLRRVRHWTVTEILRPITGTHTGPGRHRRYERSTVYLVALLNVLANMSLSIGVLKEAAKEIRRLGVVDEEHERLLKSEPDAVQKEFRALKGRERRLWNDALAGSGQVYLTLSFWGNFEDPQVLNSVHVELCSADEIHKAFGELADGLIAIDATRVFRRLALS